MTVRAWRLLGLRKGAELLTHTHTVVVNTYAVIRKTIKGKQLHQISTFLGQYLYVPVHHRKGFCCLWRGRASDGEDGPGFGARGHHGLQTTAGAPLSRGRCLQVSPSLHRPLDVDLGLGLWSSALTWRLLGLGLWRLVFYRELGWRMWLCERFGCVLDFDTVMCSGAARRSTGLFLVLRSCVHLNLSLWLSLGAVGLLLDFRLWRRPSLDRPESGHKGEVGNPRLEDYGSAGLEVDGSS